ncbi:LysR family transcriptional regulator [Hoeflea marina]|uniref:LysR family transcriptional regulator n=1 Tax=Hoeflea marina TaxID=274592 RepID=A0A317PLV6_9HYPH|nr:LysR substrate-binding domain-containing protein [Hoeflea marina]PWW01945.1 LysR family transcriptional regulator [Hoeflea marina]
MDDEAFKPREIEVFAAVMMHGTATRAAEALELTQPAVSKTLARFQEKAGFEVFKKHRQRLVPTQEAHMLYAEVQRVYESARQISRTARDIRNLQNGRLSICSLPAIGLTVLPGIVAEFSEAHPDLPVTIDIRSSATAIEWAGRRQIDLGIAVTSMIENPSITRRTLAATKAVCVMPKGHALGRLDVVRPEDIEGLRFISFGTTDPLRQQIDRVCEEAGVRRELHIECALAAAVIDFVAKGAGISIVDDISAWNLRHAVDIRPFTPELQIELSLYRPWGTLQTAVGTAFSDHLIRRIREISRQASALARNPGASA